MKEEIKDYIKNKKHFIRTNTNLREFGYIRNGKRNGIQAWKLYIPRLKKTLKEKIERKQNHISTNEDISKEGYRKMHKQKNGTQIWERIEYSQNYYSSYHKIHIEHIHKKNKKWYEKHKEEKLEANKKWEIEHKEERKQYQLEYSRIPKRKKQISEYYFDHKEKTKVRHKKYYQSHQEEYKEYRRRYGIEHKDELKEKARIYRQTPQGKLSSRKGSHIHRKKGFILLFELENIENIEIDYHHVSKNMPFVIPVPRSIHRSIGGEKHYLEVTTKFCGWLKEHPEIKIKEMLQ